MDDTWMALDTPHRLVAYLLACGITLEHQPGGVLRLTARADCPIPIGPMVEAVAAHQAAILQLVPEVTSE